MYKRASKKKKLQKDARTFSVMTAMTNTRMLSFIEVNCALKDYKYAHRQIENGVERTAVFYFQPTQ